MNSTGNMTVGYSMFYLTAKNGSNALAVRSALMEALHWRLNESDALSARRL
jgi:hypothetical protein